MMFLQRSSRALRAQRHLHEGLRRIGASGMPGNNPSRNFHASRPLLVVKPVLLADIGEGIVECEIIQWFVEPDARIEEFAPLCEVQSDKASVEITSRFSGVVKKLYYEAGEMAKVGKPFVDIDIQGDVKKEDLEALTPSEPVATPTASEASESNSLKSAEMAAEGGTSGPPPQPAATPATPAPPAPSTSQAESSENGTKLNKGRLATLATPAVRHLTKEHKVDISEISGTGKDGRVLKEDVFKFIEARDNPPASSQHSAQPVQPADGATAQTETTVPLTNTQHQMFKAMTRSLAIPHFLYADEIDFSALATLRTRMNRVIAASPSASSSNPEFPVSKLTYLPFVIKALSLAMIQYPVLNARVSIPDSPSANNTKPALIHRTMHNIGVAMDTPQGLLVPVIKAVNTRSILSIAAELSRLQSLASTGRLTSADMSGGTITVSNIGNIGGTYLSPVIVEREVAILGIGRVRAVPAFGGAGGSEVVRKEVCNFSWSADHRVVDGATLARAAEMVRRAVEDPDLMVMQLR